jgi:ribokinase
VRTREAKPTRPAGRRGDILAPMDPCVDLLVSVADAAVAFGQRERIIPDYVMELGGSVCIFASQAAKLGLRTSGIGRVGRDAPGRLVLERLREAGVDVRGVIETPGLKTGFGTALCRPDGDRAILTYLGSIDALLPDDVERAMARGARHLHVGSYFLMGKLRAAWPSLLKEARRRNMTVSLDTNWDPEEKWEGVHELLPLVDVFMPNEAELLALTGRASVDKALRDVRRLVPVTVVKRGGAGATAASTDGTHRCQSPRGRVVDTVGAGDSFDAGFLYGLLRNHGVAQSLRFGCICGSLSTRTAGGIAGQPEAARLRAFMREVEW